MTTTLRNRWSLNADARNVAIVLAIATLLWAPRFRIPIDMRWDAAVYYLLGTSLAQGGGYRLLNEPGEIEAVQYPPLVPCLVAVHQRALGTGDPDVVGPFLGYTYLAINLAYLAAVYALTRMFVAARYALPTTLIACIHLFTTWMAGALFAEIPFALVTVLFLLLHKGGGGRARFASMAILGVASYLIRTTGIALLAAWVVEAVWNRQWRQVLVRTVVLLIPVLAWQSYIGRVKSGHEYAHPAYAYQRKPYLFYNVPYTENLMMVDSMVPELGMATPADLAYRLMENLARIPRSLGEATTGGRNDPSHLANEEFSLKKLRAYAGAYVATGVGCLVILGLCALLASGEVLLVGYVVASIVLMCLTPWPGQFMRYLTPLIPVVALALCESLLAVGRLVERRSARSWVKFVPSCVSLVLWLVVAKDSYTTANAYREWYAQRALFANGRDASAGRLYLYDRFWAGFDQSIGWLRDHAQPGDVVASSTPQWVYLKGGMKAVMPPMEAEMARIQESLDSVPVRYLITEDLYHGIIFQRFLNGPVAAYPDRWELVYESTTGGSRVYRRVGPVPPTPRVDDRPREKPAPAQGPGPSSRPSGKKAVPSAGTKVRSMAFSR